MLFSTEHLVSVLTTQIVRSRRGLHDPEDHAARLWCVGAVGLLGLRLARLVMGAEHVALLALAATMTFALPDCSNPGCSASAHTVCQSKADATDCSATLAGNVCDTSRTKCCIRRSCDKGRYSQDCGKVGCKDCPTGKFASDKGVQVCSACPLGKYQDNTAKEDCDQCPAAKYAAVGSKSCKDCPKGKYYKSGDPECVQCAAGFYQNVNGATKCRGCSKGKHTENATGQQECQQCPAGRFADSVETSICALCLPGL